MPRDPRVRRLQRLEYALEAADMAMRHADGLSYADFTGSTLHQDAVLMQIMQIAENLKPLDDPDGDLRSQITAVGRIIGMRNVIAHEYRSVEVRVVWDVVTKFIPELRPQLLALIEAG